MSVGAEVHAGGDSRKGTAFPQTQPALWSFGLCLALKKEDRVKELLSVCRDVQRSSGQETNLVAVGLRGQLLVQRGHVGCQSLESVPDFVLLSSGDRPISREQKRSELTLEVTGVLFRHAWCSVPPRADPPAA